MSPLQDVRVVLGKEWLELRSSDSPWVTLTTLSVFVAVIGVAVPWQLGPLWIEAPWTLLLWTWLPMFVVTTITADSVAGERERRTLETLLATRLSEGAILWGKWLAAVTWTWIAMAICLPAGLLTLNLTNAGGPFLPSLPQAAGTLAVAFLGAGVGAAAGVLVSLRAESVRNAQQLLAIGAVVLAVIPIVVLGLLPGDWAMEVVSVLTSGSVATAAWLLSAVLAAATLLLLQVARTRFRRGRIPLK